MRITSSIIRGIWSTLGVRSSKSIPDSACDENELNTKTQRAQRHKESRHQRSFNAGFLCVFVPFVSLCFLPRLFSTGFQRFRLGSDPVLAGILQGFFPALSFLREGLDFA